jgi:hypothetical protein
MQEDGLQPPPAPKGAARAEGREALAPGEIPGGPAPALDVIPAPKRVTLERGEFELDEFAALLVSDQATAGTRAALRVVQLGIRERFGLDLPILRVSEERRHAPRKMVWIVEPRMLRPDHGDYQKFLKRPGPLVPHPPERTIGVRGLQFTEEMAVEGYFLRVDPIAVVIHGASDAGSYWGAQTLLQLLRPPRKGGLFRRGRGPTLPCLWMADWPSNVNRIVPPELKVPAEPDAAEGFLRLAAHYKVNGIPRCSVPADEAVREPCIEKPVPLPGEPPLLKLALEAAAEGRTRLALAAFAEAAWGARPEADAAAFRQRFLREAGEEEPAPRPPAP